mmetsp:Transcript_8151/g.16269  ORF Transcript_8151/g.16269 Transcript_8151/m.16269 type:complete len:80 (-) Transcript_8151:456-695(-)
MDLSKHMTLKNTGYLALTTASLTMANILFNFLFPRIGSLHEDFPLQVTFKVVDQIDQMLELMVEYMDMIYKNTGKKSFI